MREATIKPPSFPAIVQQFFTEYLVAQRALSPQTVACYRDAIKLFLGFAASRLRKSPATMRLTDITPELILSFLDNLEAERQNSVRSRNLRLTALRTFLKFAGRRDVTALHSVERALGVPMKRFDRPMLGYLSRPEIIAVLGQPGGEWTLQRDHLLLTLLYNTGARVSEIIGVRVDDVVLDGAACVHLLGKGRKQRSVPLWKSTVAATRAWLRGESAAARRCGPASQSIGPGDDALQRDAAIDVRRGSRHGRGPRPEGQANFSPHPEAYDSHASVAERRALQRHSAVARSREHEHDPPLRRSQPGNEGAGAGSTRGPGRQANAFPCDR